MKMNKYENILIIGSDGYIGSVLVNFLKKKKFKVTTLDTGYFRDGTIEKCIKSNLNIDVRKLRESTIKKFDVVLFLAASQNDPSDTINSNKFYEISKKYTLRIAKICKKNKIKFIFPSSCSVYGYGKKEFNEKSKTFPLTNYSKNKIEIEKALSKLACRNFSPIALRFSTVFGFSPRIRLDLVINMLSMLAITTKKIILNSNGLAWRPHININDVCLAFYLSIVSDIENGKLNIFNVGHNKNNIRIIDIAKIISKLTKTRIYYKFDKKKSLIYDRNIKNGADKRSYKVNFLKFNNKFPQFKQKNNIKLEIKFLIKKLKKLKVNEKTLNNYKFYRLQKMEFLLKNKRLNNNLYWL